MSSIESRVLQIEGMANEPHGLTPEEREAAFVEMVGWPTYVGTWAGLLRFEHDRFVDWPAPNADDEIDAAISILEAAEATRDEAAARAALNNPVVQHAIDTLRKSPKAIGLPE